MRDRWGALGAVGSAESINVVTPADATDLAEVARALYVGGTGNLSVVRLDGTTVAFVGVPAGTILPIRIRGVNQTGTTATDIVALA